MRLKLFLITFLLLCMSCQPVKKEPKESNYERVIGLGQAAIELLLELGLEDKIVGIAYFDNLGDFTVESSLPVLSTNWTDKETILALKPDLIFAMEAAFRSDRIGSETFWNKRGVKTFIVDNYKEEKCFENYCKDIQNTGELFDIPHKTDPILKRITETRGKYSRKKPQWQRILHLSFIGNNQMYYYPPGMCLIDEIIEDCGGSFINLGDKSFIISTEAIIEAKPDKIIVTQFRKQRGDIIINKLINNPILNHLPVIKNHLLLEVDYTQAIRGAADMEDIYNKTHNFLKE